MSETGSAGLSPREFQREPEAKQIQVAFQNLIDRVKLRQWCVEQVIKAGFKDDVELVKAAQEVFDFCCEDIEAWLARKDGQ